MLPSYFISVFFSTNSNINPYSPIRMLANNILLTVMTVTVQYNTYYGMVSNLVYYDQSLCGNNIYSKACMKNCEISLDGQDHCSIVADGNM